MPKLTAIQIRNAKPGRLADGNGLFLITKASGTQSWSLRIMVDGKRKEIGLGSTRELTLKQARDKADELRVTAKQTKTLPRKPATAPTFHEAAETFIDLNAGKWKHDKSVPQWRNSLATYAKPILNLSVDQITTPDVVQCLLPIWTSKAPTAERVLRRIRQVLSYSIAMGQRPGPNPAEWRDNLSHILPAQKASDSHFAAVPVKEARAVFQELWQRRDKGNSYRALCFTVLGAFRSGEVRNMVWSDLDSDHVLIPGNRMKAGKDHRVPLTDAMRELLPHRMASTELVFPGNRDKTLSDMSLSACHRRLDIDATVHGWRSTFADWANEQGFNRDHIDDALAHQVGNAVSRAYRRGDYMEQRREIMQAWANFLI